eukprot:g12302.t1
MWAESDKERASQGVDYLVGHLVFLLHLDAFRRTFLSFSICSVPARGIGVAQQLPGHPGLAFLLQVCKGSSLLSFFLQCQAAQL